MWYREEYAYQTGIQVDVERLKGAYIELNERYGDQTAFRTGNDQRSEVAPTSRLAGWGWRLYDQDESVKESHEDFSFLVPNAYCYGYIREILEFFPRAFKPTLWTMPPGFLYNYHVDVPEDSYRMHIAIDTNGGCTHVWKDEKGEHEYHIPSDGSVWIIRTDVLHTAKNDGTTNRTHLYWRMPIETIGEYEDVHATIA